MSKISEEIELTQMISNNYPKRKPDSMATKERITLCCKVGITIFCVSGLLVCASILCSQYFKRRTVVSITFETWRRNHKIPAFTVCYPELLSMERMAEFYPKLKRLKKNYNELVKKAINKDYKDKIFTEKLDKIYDNFRRVRNENKTITVKDLFDFSLPYKPIERDPTYPENIGQPLIEAKVTGNYHYKNGTSELKDIEDIYPIETIVFKGKSDHKCFTFFSHLNKTWRITNIDVIEVNITIRHNVEYFPFNRLIKENLHLSMHSPNTIPLFLGVNNFRPIKTNHNIEITYNRWKTILLKSPYKTNCKDYNMKEDQDFQFRSACINICIHNMINDCIKNEGLIHNFDHTECVFPTEAIWTRQVYAKNISIKPCSDRIGLRNSENKYIDYSERQCLFKRTDQFESQCVNQCQPECYNRYYRYNIVKEEQTNMGFTNVKIVHDQFPDQFTEHMPETTGIAFFGNFGGLLGMWLGLSALAILKFMLKIITRLSSKCLIKTAVKCKFCSEVRDQLDTIDYAYSNASTL